MKKCANCGYECADEALSCPSCTTDAFISTSPEALGHIISPEEQRFWERMTFRQFAILTIRLQALWLLFYAVIDATYLVDYLVPPAHFTLYARLLVLRVGLHVALAIICLRYADRIVSWFVKDLVPRAPAHATEKTDSSTGGNNT
jgi:hypothetical protein